jgi:hypothetical protein
MQENPLNVQDQQSSEPASAPQWHAPVLTCFDADSAENGNFTANDGITSRS